MLSPFSHGFFILKIMELIKITEKNGKQLVSARELHKFLEVKSTLVIWCKRMFEYGFKEDMDYTAIKSENPVNKQVGVVDYALLLDCAKEISMIQRSDKGKEAREYFISCETQLKEIIQAQLPQNYLEALKALIVVEEQKQLQESQIKELAPKAELADTLLSSSAAIAIGQFAKATGKIGPNKLFAFLRDNGYLLPTGHKKNTPYQRYIDQGIFEVIEHSIKMGDRDVITFQTLITPKGQDRILKLLV